MEKGIRQAVELSPELENETFIMQGHAFELLHMGHHEEAVNKISEAWNALPEPKFNTSCSDTILVQFVETLNAVGQAEKARPMLDAWILDLETCGYKIYETTAYILSGENYLFAGMPEEAKAELYKAVKHGATKRDFSDIPALYFEIANKKITNTEEILAQFKNVKKEIGVQGPMEASLSEEASDAIDRLSEKGNKLFDEEEYDLAISAWQQALSLIPAPQRIYGESQWLETSIGDALFFQEKYDDSLKSFQNAAINLENNSYENPFIMLRLGQTLLENHFPMEAKEYLLIAYMSEGEEIFQNDDPKYFEFLKAHIKLN